VGKKWRAAKKITSNKPLVKDLSTDRQARRRRKVKKMVRGDTNQGERKNAFPSSRHNKFAQRIIFHLLFFRLKIKKPLVRDQTAAIS